VVKAKVHIWTDRFNQAVFLFGGNEDAAIVAKDLEIELKEYGYNWIRLKSHGMSLRKSRRVKS
jgi:hypothetical protein